MTTRFWVLLFFATLLGCGGNPTLAQSGGQEQTRALAGDCVYSPVRQGEEAAITKFLDAVTGGVISGTLGRIGKALRAAGEEDADVVVGRDPAEFIPGQPAPCIILAKGLWTSDKDNAWSVTHKNGTGTMHLKTTDDRYLRNPDFLLEVSVERSSGGNALRLVPNYFHYVRLIEDDMKRGKPSSRGIAFEVSVHPPGVGPGGKGAVGASLVLGTLATGYAYDLRAGKRFPLTAAGQPQWDKAEDDYLPLEHTSAWFPTFAPQAEKATNKKETQSKPAKTPATATTGTPKPGDSVPPRGSTAANSASGNKAAIQLLPRTVTVTFTETRAPRKFLLFLADVFDASKDELQKAAELAVIDSKRAEAELAAAKASTGLMTDYVTKQAAAEVAILEYCAAGAARTDRIKKSSAANVAQRTANLAAVAALQPQPYTDLVETSGGDPGDSGFCAD